MVDTGLRLVKLNDLYVKNKVIKEGINLEKNIWNSYTKSKLAI